MNPLKSPFWFSILALVFEQNILLINYSKMILAIRISYVALIISLGSIHRVQAQNVRDFFKVSFENAELPVFVRGNLKNKTILLFVQGGPGETAIDFGKVDYPKWNNTLENDVAIAYYDQRGLNQKVKNIDSNQINYGQYSRDLLKIAEELKSKYKAKIYLIGHSIGGNFVLHCMSIFPNRGDIIAGAILLNTPITNDHSPERYTYYRPLYLKNLAKEKIEMGVDSTLWTEALNWMEETDSIYSPETSRQWNDYVDLAFIPHKGKINLFAASGAILSKPYGLFTYINQKDNELVSDLLWYDAENYDFFERLKDIPYHVLLVSGRYDGIATPEELMDAAKLLPNSTLQIIPDAGHQSFLDNPELVNKRILNYLKIRID